MVAQILILLAAGVGTGALLDIWAGHDDFQIFWLAFLGSFVSYTYSAPPFKLKKNWIGNYALGASYITFPWLAGQVRPVPLLSLSPPTSPSRGSRASFAPSPSSRSRLLHHLPLAGAPSCGVEEARPMLLLSISPSMPLEGSVPHDGNPGFFFCFSCFSLFSLPFMPAHVSTCGCVHAWWLV